MKLRITAAILPLLLVNIIAVSGQADFWIHHLPGFPVIAGIGFAAALESIAIFLAVYAHLAAVSDDASLRLRLASYGMGVIIGLLNASHFVIHGRITAAAVGMGLLSASSPVLWGIFSRRQSRDKLRAAGLIESHALRLGTVRWLFHPARSFEVFRLAAWDGINVPADAIAKWETRPQPEPEPETKPEPSQPEPELTAPRPARAITAPRQRTSQPGSQAAAITQAFETLGWETSAPDVTAWLAERAITVTPAAVRQVRSRAARREIETRRDSMRAISNGHKTG
jgi:hypothetical protein